VEALRADLAAKLLVIFGQGRRTVDPAIEKRVEKDDVRCGDVEKPRWVAAAPSLESRAFRGDDLLGDRIGVARIHVRLSSPGDRLQSR
jgi:hypothetical protein